MISKSPLAKLIALKTILVLEGIGPQTNGRNSTNCAVFIAYHKNYIPASKSNAINKFDPTIPSETFVTLLITTSRSSSLISASGFDC